MNRHSPLFRVAFTSLLAAIGLPLLVFTAAHVRHRQLQSKANPRWAKFAEVNGPQLAVEKAKGTEPVVMKPVAGRFSTADRLTTRPVSQSNGITGSATGTSPRKTALGETIPMEMPHESSSLSDTRNPVRSTEAQLSRQTAELTPTTPDRIEPVPQPDEESPRSQPRRAVVATPDAREPRQAPVEVAQVPDEEAASRRLEARLAGLQRRIEQLAQEQRIEQRMSDLDRAMNLLKESQQSQQASSQSQAPQSPTPQPPLPQSPVPQTSPPQSPAPQSQLPPTSNPSVVLPQTSVSSPVPAPVVAQQLPPSPSETLDPEWSGTGTESSDAKGRELSIKVVPGHSKSADDEKFAIQVRDASVKEVLDMLGQLAGVNILSSCEFKGHISLNLPEISVDRALDAILKSQGCVHERQGDFIYIRTLAEDAALKQASRKVINKVYQLRYVPARDVERLLEPVLTRGVGRHGVTPPAPEASVTTPSAAESEGLTQRDTVVVQDYPEVISEVDRIVAEVDVPPLQVMIEARILSVALSDSQPFGINLATLNGNYPGQWLASNGASPNAPPAPLENSMLNPSAGGLATDSTGLKYGYISGDPNTFIESLQMIAETSVLASTNLHVVNRQKAELMIGERLSCLTPACQGTQLVQNASCLDAGIKLMLRPVFSSDGQIRFEIRREHGNASINAATGLPCLDMTEVTTNLLVRDGATIAIGGLVTEEIIEITERVPLLGSIPFLGAAFRCRSEQAQRTEIIVLITPHVMREPGLLPKEQPLPYEAMNRASWLPVHMASANRSSVTQVHYERACEYFDQGNLPKARQQIDLALQKNRCDTECQRMKLKIDRAIQNQPSKSWKGTWMWNRPAGS